MMKEPASTIPQDAWKRMAQTQAGWKPFEDRQSGIRTPMEMAYIEYMQRHGGGMGGGDDNGGNPDPTNPQPTTRKPLQWTFPQYSQTWAFTPPILPWQR